MLILTRKINESIIIGHGERAVRIEVLNIQDSKSYRKDKYTQVKLGIDGPRDIPVHRESIYNRIYGEEGEDECQQTEENQICHYEKENLKK